MQPVLTETKRGNLDSLFSIETTKTFWWKRSPEMQSKVDENILKLSIRKPLLKVEGQFQFIREFEMALRMIQQFPLKSSFTFVGAGEGMGAWGESLLEFLTENKVDSSVKIVTLSASKEFESKAMKIGSIESHAISRFSLENFYEEFTKRFPQTQIELLVSRNVFDKFVDPIGTFAQMYDLLHLWHAYMIVDKFPFCVNGVQMSSLCQIMAEFRWGHVIDFGTHYLIQKRFDIKFDIPFTYDRKDVCKVFELTFGIKGTISKQPYSSDYLIERGFRNRVLMNIVEAENTLKPLLRYELLKLERRKAECLGCKNFEEVLRISCGQCAAKFVRTPYKNLISSLDLMIGVKKFGLIPSILLASNPTESRLLNFSKLSSFKVPFITALAMEQISVKDFKDVLRTGLVTPELLGQKPSALIYCIENRNFELMSFLLPLSPKNLLAEASEYLDEKVVVGADQTSLNHLKNELKGMLSFDLYRHAFVHGFVCRAFRLNGLKRLVEYSITQKEWHEFSISFKSQQEFTKILNLVLEDLSYAEALKLLELAFGDLSGSLSENLVKFLKFHLGTFCDWHSSKTPLKK